MNHEDTTQTLRTHEIALALREAWVKHSRVKTLRWQQGIQLASAQSTLTDTALVAIFEEALARRDNKRITLALIALGGYGRRELCPRSDIDVAIIYEGRSRGISDVASAIWYPLWDAGFRLGHAVRTIRESIAGASNNLELLTSHLDSRFIAGDRQLALRLGSKIRELLARKSRNFIEELVYHRAQRITRPGRQWGALEPELKLGVGGTRDLQTIDWLGRAMGCESTIAMVDSELISAEEAEVIEEARKVLLATRFAIHGFSERKGDKLDLELQERLVDVLEEESVTSLMRKLHQTMLDVSQILRNVRLASLGRTPSIGCAAPSNAADAIQPYSEMATAVTSPDVGSRLGLMLTESDGPWIESRTRSALTRWVRDCEQRSSPPPWSRAAVTALQTLLTAGPGAGAALAAMASSGVLYALFPELSKIKGLTQHNPYHQVTVDAHLFTTLSICGDTDPEIPGGTILSQTAKELDRDLPCHLAMLFHDAGKGVTGNHSITGASLLEAVSARIGLNSEEAARACRIVENHLLLADFATRRDLTDPDVIAEVARRVRDAPTLKALYLLTVADSRATGPAAWSHWKAELVRSLFLATLDHLQRGADASRVSFEDRVELLRQQFACHAGDHDIGETLDSLIRTAPRSFITSVQPETIGTCLELTKPDLLAGEVRIGTRQLGAGLNELVIVTRDQPWLLNRIAGILTLNNFSIHSATLATTDGGIAIDVLTIQHRYETEVSRSRWEKLRVEMGKALLGKIAISHRLKERSRRESESGAENDVLDRVRVVIDNEASTDFTVIELHARDREGFLYQATRVLSELGLDIHLAKIATMGPEVVDVFYVNDITGSKVTDDEHLNEIRAGLGSLYA